MTAALLAFVLVHKLPKFWVCADVSLKHDSQLSGNALLLAQACNANLSLLLSSYTTDTVLHSCSDSKSSAQSKIK